MSGSQTAYKTEAMPPRLSGAPPKYCRTEEAREDRTDNGFHLFKNTHVGTDDTGTPVGQSDHATPVAITIARQRVRLFGAEGSLAA